MTCRLFLSSLVGWLAFLSAARGAEPEQVIRTFRDRGWMVAIDDKNVTQLGSPGGQGKQATLEDIAHLALFPKLRVLRLSGDKVTDDSLSVLKKLSALRELALNCPRLTDAAVKHLQNLPDLTNLMLRNTKITSDGFKQLPVMAKVVSLNLGGDHFTAAAVEQLPRLFPNAVTLDFNHPNKLKDADLAPLAKMEHVEFVILGGAIFLGDGITNTLAQMKQLRKLEVGHVSGFSDKGIEALKELPKLEMIQLGSRGVTDAGLAHLAAIKSLKEIVLGDPCPISAAGIKHLVALPHLTKLALQTPSLTDEVMASVVKMSALEELDLVSNGFTDAALIHLDELPRLKKLRLGEYYRQPALTNAGLKHLGKLKGLKQILISNKCTAVTEKGIAELKTALPKVNVYR